MQGDLVGYFLPGHLRKKMGFQDEEREHRGILPEIKHTIARFRAGLGSACTVPRGRFQTASQPLADRFSNVCERLWAQSHTVVWPCHTSGSLTDARLSYKIPFVQKKILEKTIQSKKDVRVLDLNR